MAKESAARAKKPPGDGGDAGKVRSIRIPLDLDTEITQACFQLGHEFNRSRFARDAFEILLERWRRQYNGGKPFVGGPVKLKVGRPMNPPRRKP